jgi:ketosteroid isomerase-like protein
MSNVGTVQEIYGAFGRGDVPAILEKLHEDVSWDADETPGVPWLKARRGRGNVAGFFEALAPLQFDHFEPHTFFESGDKIFVLLRMDMVAKSTGAKYHFENEGHLWQFDSAGKVIAYQHVTDTAKHRAAAGAA